MMEMITRVFLTVLFGSTGFLLTAPTPNREPALRKQVNAYYSAFSEGRYELTMSSRNFRQKNDNDKAAYVAYLRKAGPIKAKAKIKDMHITGNRAVVAVILSLWSEPYKKFFDEEQRNVWVFERGKWLFDSQIDETGDPPKP